MIGLGHTTLRIFLALEPGDTGFEGSVKNHHFPEDRHPFSTATEPWGNGLPRHSPIQPCPVGHLTLSCRIEPAPRDAPSLRGCSGGADFGDSEA